MTQKRKILLITHYTATQGMADKFLNFLKVAYSVGFLAHPLYPTSPLKSFYSFDSSKKEIKTPPAIQYFSEIIINVWFINFYKKFDLIICFDPLSFFNIYFYKLFLNKNVVLVYYNLDYSKERFSNSLMNTIYQSIHRFAFNKSNYFLSPTSKVIEDFDPEKRMRGKCFVLRHSVDVKKIHKRKRFANSIIFAGTLGLTVDFHELFIACQKMEKKNIPYRFDIYGEGAAKQQIVDDVEQLHLKNITFYNSVENEKLVNDVLPQYMISVAPYITKKRKGVPDHIFHGTDITSKIVEYMAAGLPVISTKLYKAFEIIEEKKYGLLVDTSEDWFDAITKLFTKDSFYKQYKKNAEKEVLKYDVEYTVTPLIEKFLS